MLAMVLVLSLAACGDNSSKDDTSETVAETVAETTEDTKIEIPDIEGTDETTAKNLLSSNGLIPKIEQEYDDFVEKGNVIRTDPVIGTKVEKNSKVTVYISKGASRIYFKSGNITWSRVSTGDDYWEANTPYIEEEVLYIPCKKVKFSVPLKWDDNLNKGELLGEASINDTFDKTVPVRAKYEKQSWNANAEQSFTLEIPLSELNVDKPTDLYLRLFAYINNDNSNQINVRVSFTLTW